MIEMTRVDCCTTLRWRPETSISTA